jgi:hypothetical protein
LIFILGLTFSILFGMKGYETDEALKPWVNAFVPQPDKYVYKLVDMDMISKVQKEEGTKVVGLALMWLDTVYIDKEYWKEAGYYQRASLLIHEYGHHELGLFAFGMSSHNDKLMKDGCPESVMYSKVINDKCLRKHFVMYRQESREW